MTRAYAYGRGATALASRWWALVLRGVAAIVFGVLTFVAPRASLLVLVALFGAFALVNGILDVALSARPRSGEARWGSLLYEGIASIVLGLIAWGWPRMTALILLWVIAAWAIATGFGQIAAAVRLRRHIRGEWLLGLSGALSVVFGVLLIVFPGAGALAVAFWIGAYAVALGALLVALGLRLRSWRRTASRVAPSGAEPVSP